MAVLRTSQQLTLLLEDKVALLKLAQRIMHLILLLAEHLLLHLIGDDRTQQQ
ncbi:hypothetical protein D3C79_935070 [compost metagenome]